MTERFDVIETPLAGLKVLHRKPIGDHRGVLERLYSAADLRSLLGTQNLLQINRTKTTARGTVRGMHYQHPPHADSKFVTCLRGHIFDVAVDVRHGSATFLNWHAVELDETSPTTLLIPRGFAHGFQVLSDDCELLYFHTAEYVPESEGGLHPQDPLLAIGWPHPVSGLSVRDASRPLIGPDFGGVRL